MSVTQRDLAAALGVSVMTVNQALNATGHISPAMRRRVQMAARRLAYRRNMAARSMITGRFDCVAMVAGEAGDGAPLPTGLLGAIHDELARRGWHLTFCRLSAGEIADAAVGHKILRESMVDGLLINARTLVPPGLRKIVQRCGLPAVWIEARRPVNCVYVDHAGAAREAVRHLVELGHRRIAWFDHHRTREDAAAAHWSLDARRTSALSALAKAGLRPVEIHPAPDDPADRVLAAERCLRRWARAERPTAILCYVVASAGPLVLAASRMGIRIPRELSVMTFASRDQVGGFPVTHMRLPDEACGREAVAMLAERIERRAPDMKSRVLMTEWAAGATCAPARGGER